MTTLVFYRNPLKPCSFISSTSTFVACLGCVTAHEKRFCDGTTEPSWSFCHEHLEAYERLIMGVSRGQLHYDDDMLHFLRESVYDGSIPKPQPRIAPIQSQRSSKTPIMPSILPTPQSTPTSSDKELDPEIKLRSTYQNQSRILRIPSLHILWPNPTSSYSHASTCFHNPNVYFAAGLNQERTSPAKVSTPPTVKLITSQQGLLHLDAKHTEATARLRNEAWRRWETGDYDISIHQKLQDLRDESTTSRLAKGIFFRRCNGEYVNALGWAWDEPAMAEEPGNPDKLCAHSLTKSSVSTERLLVRESLVTHGKATDEDLIITLWAWNRQMKASAHAKVVGGNDETHGFISRG